MKKKLLLVLILISPQCYSQWTTVAAEAGTQNIYSVYAISSTALAIACDNKVSRSTNGGNTWTSPITVNPSTFYEVHSPEPAHWYALTSNTTLVC